MLRNSDFIKGYTPTGFIAQHYPDGFSGGKLSEVERKQLVAIARQIARKRGNLLRAPPLTLTFSVDDSAGEDEVIVCLGGMFGDAYVVKSKYDSDRDGVITASVVKMNEGDNTVGSQIVELCNLNYEPADDLAQVSLTGEDRAIQVGHYTF